MANSRRYVPILRYKKAELDALAGLFQRQNIDLTSLVPLFELIPNPFEKDGSIIESVSLVLEKIAQNILGCWGYEQPFLLDLWHLPLDLRCEDGRHPFVVFNTYAQVRHLHFIPVTGLDETRTRDYQSAVAHVVKENGQGACIRLHSKDLQRSTLKDEIARLLNILDVSPRACYALPEP